LIFEKRKTQKPQWSLKVPGIYFRLVAMDYIKLKIIQTSGVLIFFESFFIL